MNEQLTSKMIELSFDFFKQSFENLKIDYKWKEAFFGAADFLINNSDKTDEFEKDLRKVFSKDNLKELANKTKDVNGYHFVEALHDELLSLMLRYEIDQESAETYIHHFIPIILNFIEDNDSTRMMEIYLEEIKTEEEKKYNAIVKKLNTVLERINELGGKKIEALSIPDLELELKKESIYKGMSLDFFELDDEQFRTRFENSINDERIYVVGKSREETTLRVLNELKHRYADRIVLIIKTKDDWELLRKEPIDGNVLVPFFYSEKIVAIPGNTNIFVFGEDEPCYASKKIELRRRTKINIVRALEKIGMESGAAYDIVDKTHGLFTPLKKKLFNGGYHYRPEWKNNVSDTILTALLCGKWTDSEGDKIEIEELSGKSYSDFMKDMKVYMHRENPFVVEHTGFKGNSIQLASVEDAWEELDSFITEEIWEKFLKLFYEVLIETEPIFEYPFEKHFEAKIYAKKPEWSPLLKEGMIRTLTMRAYYRGHSENQRQIDNIVKNVLDTVITKEQWGYISQYFTDLCEASPDAVLSKIESEINETKGMMEIFEANDSNFITGSYYYTNILWALEQLVQQKKYMVRAINCLWEMDSKSVRYTISNSPQNVLNVVFCPWINEIPVSVDGKITLAKNAVDKYKNAWDLIASNLPQGGTTICSSLNKPKYRDIDAPMGLNDNDINNTYLEYLRICVETAREDVDRWVKIVEHLDLYDEKIQTDMLQKMLESCKKMEDQHKAKMKNSIRYKIYRQRYLFDKCMSNTLLQQYEKIMNAIIPDEKVYDYIYIFSPKYEFPLLNPIPFKNDSTYDEIKENEKLIDKEIRDKVSDFKLNNYSIDRLIQISIEEKYKMIGEVLAAYYSEGKFDKKIFDILIKYDATGELAYNYIREVNMIGKLDLTRTIKIVKESLNNDTLLVNLISLQQIDNVKDCIISEESENIKEIFWKQDIIHRLSKNADSETYKWAINECEKYGNVKTYISLLFEANDKLSKSELFDAFIKTTNVSFVDFDSMAKYYFEKVLNELQPLYIDDEEKCVQLARIEWLFKEILDWEQMKCLQKIVKSDPTFYAEIIRIIFKDDDGIPSEDSKTVQVSDWYSGYDKMKFCPAEKKKAVEYEDLKRWIDELKNILQSNNQQRVFGHVIGRLLAYSPIDEDGYSPCTAVRRIIEDNNYYSDELKTSYIVAEENKRGVFTVDAGKSEFQLHERYLKNAEMIQTNYPKTADIYYALSDIYKHESEFERKRAEDEW